MSFGHNGFGPQGAPIFGNQGPAAAPVAAGAVPGQAGAPANGASVFYNTSFESVMAAVSRGEISLNIAMSPTNNGLAQAGGQLNQVTLLQAMSQGVPQNGTNGIGVVSGFGIGAGNGGPNTAQVSGNGALGSATTAASGNTGTTFGGTQVVDAKQLMNSSGVVTSSPIQYGGN